jgi:hypothetical protein
METWIRSLTQKCVNKEIPIVDYTLFQPIQLEENFDTMSQTERNTLHEARIREFIPTLIDIPQYDNIDEVTKIINKATN